MIRVLSGTNQYALERALEDLRAKFLKTHTIHDIELRDGATLEPEELPQLLSGVSLFSAERMVIIRMASANKALSETLVEMADATDSQTEIVLVEPSLDKRTVLYKKFAKTEGFQEFKQLSEQELAGWVSGRAVELGATISQADARFLVQAVGDEQSRLSGEIEKLAAYDPAITRGTIDLLVEPNPRDTVFQLLDHTLNGKVQRAIETLEGLEAAHEDPYQIASMLVWQTHILAVVHSAQQRSETVIAKEAKINPYVVKKTKALASGMSRTKLEHIISEVAELDIALKTNGTQPWRLLEATISRL